MLEGYSRTAYSRGGDLPPMMRDSLLADETAAGAFNALCAADQQSMIERCAAMSSRAEVDELIRQTDSCMFGSICLSETDTSLL